MLHKKVDVVYKEVYCQNWQEDVRGHTYNK